MAVRLCNIIDINYFAGMLQGGRLMRFSGESLAGKSFQRFEQKKAGCRALFFIPTALIFFLKKFEKNDRDMA